MKCLWLHYLRQNKYNKKLEGRSLFPPFIQVSSLPCGFATQIATPLSLNLKRWRICNTFSQGSFKEVLINLTSTRSFAPKIFFIQYKWLYVWADIPYRLQNYYITNFRVCKLEWPTFPKYPAEDKGLNNHMDKGQLLKKCVIRSEISHQKAPIIWIFVRVMSGFISLFFRIWTTFDVALPSRSSDMLAAKVAACEELN